VIGVLAYLNNFIVRFLGEIISGQPFAQGQNGTGGRLKKANSG
jgi:hypothetical protein